MFPLQVNIPLKIFSKYVLYQSGETLLFHKRGHHIEFILSEFPMSRCYIKGVQSKYLLRFYISCELWNSSLNQRFTFFAAVNNLSGPLRKQKLTSAGSKGCVCWSWLVDSNPFFFCGSRFVDCHHNFDWWQEKTQSSVRLWTSEFACYWKPQ